MFYQFWLNGNISRDRSVFNRVKLDLVCAIVLARDTGFHAVQKQTSTLPPIWRLPTREPLIT